MLFFSTFGSKSPNPLLKIQDLSQFPLELYSLNLTELLRTTRRRLLRREKKIEKKFNKLTVKRRKMHKFLGLDYNWSKKEHVKVSMIKYLHETINEFQ